MGDYSSAYDFNTHDVIRCQGDWSFTIWVGEQPFRVSGIAPALESRQNKVQPALDILYYRLNRMATQIRRKVGDYKLSNISKMNDILNASKISSAHSALIRDSPVMVQLHGMIEAFRRSYWKHIHQCGEVEIPENGV